MLSCEKSPKLRVRYICEDEMPNKGWVLKPVDLENNTFLIKNFKYDEYLYATNTYLAWFTKGRPIYTAKLPKKMENVLDYSEYVWRFEVRANKSGYTVWNDKYNERKKNRKLF